MLFSLSLLLLLLGVSAVSAEDIGLDDNPLSIDCENDVFVESDYSSLECLSNDAMTESSSNELENSVDSSGSDLEGNVLGSKNLKGSPDSRVLKGSVSSSNIANDPVYVISSDNISEYFDESNVLKSNYSDGVLVFDGLFDDLGVLKIYSNNTRITGSNSIFQNTVFDLGASGIVLSNLNFVLDKEFEDNEYAAIYCHGDNITVYNCTINYNTPANKTAFGIYSNGHHNDFVGLNIINNTIKIIGHALGANDYNYGILLRDTHDSLVYGNTIDCELPIKFIVWSFYGSYGSVSRDTVAAFAGDYCENLTLSNNYIHTSVNGGDNNYPTLDTVVLYGCSYSLIEKNTIISEDFYTKPGYDNYLQALDLYSLHDITVIKNNISVFTNGGISGMGTAYPIQITGPIDHAKIAFNNLTTFSRGPNCGIYSNNYGGDTFIDIISNFINVTGDATNNATNPSWCLVSGIEVQDTGDNILNNTIIVNNLGDYKSSNNVYGISYVQNIGGKHTYNIQYNNITTNGNYGVKLIGKVKDSDTYNSTISNNVINTRTTSNRTGASTNRQVEGPSGTNIKNNTNGNPKNVMSEDDYPDWLKDYLDNNNIHGTGDFSWIGRAINTLSNGSGFSDAVGNGTGSWGSGNASGNGHSGADGPVSGRGNNSESSTVNGDPNSTVSTPGVSDDSIAAISPSSPSDAGSSAQNPRAYEIDESEGVAVKSSENLQLALICIVALLLLGIGYKRQKDKEEEE